MDESRQEPIAQFPAIVWKVQTIAAGGARVAFDLTSDQLVQAAYLMQLADTPGAWVLVTVERWKDNQQQEEE
jgi:hypothetical protein